MIFYDMVLIGTVVLFDLCALWLTVNAFKDPGQMSELETAIVGFIFIACAITLSFITAINVTQSSHFKQLYHSDGKPFESPSRTFGDGSAKMWKF